MLGLKSLPKSKSIHPSSQGRCSYVVVPPPPDGAVPVDGDGPENRPGLAFAKRERDGGESGDVIVVVVVVVLLAVGVVAQDVPPDDLARRERFVEKVDSVGERTSLSGLKDENRLEALLEPLGGGVQVRLIFSKGIEHTTSWSEAVAEGDRGEAEQQLAASEKAASASCIPSVC